tara:strand:+ start:345 stop:965 length:621 start_codon:yes stop_codon:yes gene_type:complete
MAFRLEEKIELHISDYIKILSLIKSNGGSEIFSERKISSTYFDNKNYDMFLDSEEGCLPRKKIRIRNYPNDKITSFYLQKKISSVEGKFKKSNKISLKDNKNFLDYGIFDGEYGLCTKNIKITYTRKYFKLMNSRITLDRNILFEIPDKKIHFLENKNLILEIKAGATIVKEIFNNEIPYQRSRYSKYCIGINFLYGKDHFQRIAK